ncbi:MAG: YceI family protein [Saprospiraceae bacterium]|nr:YceI family protein [Saprospiraceae bacterium]
MLRNLFIYILSFAFFLSSCKDCKTTECHGNTLDLNASVSDSFQVDPEQSLVYWSGASPSGPHNGLVKMAGGELYFQGDMLISGEIRVDMRTIENLDIQEEVDRKDLESHLKDVDFFNVDTFPMSVFRITSAETSGNTLYNLKVNGSLNIKGISQNISVNGNIQKTEQRVFVSIPEFNIDRTQYNIMYQSKKILPSIKDGFIDDDISLSIKLSGIRISVN